MTHNFDSLPANDVLSRSRFHFLLVAFYAPAGWPTALVALAGVGVAAVVAAAWWLPARDTPCLLYPSPSPRDPPSSRMPPSA